MREKKQRRNCMINITVTEGEKIAIAREAEREKRTISNYIRCRLQDILEGIDDDGIRV